MKLIILVISSKGEHFQALKKTQKETWNNSKHSNIPTFYLYNNSNLTETKEEKNDIFLPYNEGLKQVGYKTIGAFEHIYKNYDFDYIYRTNLSSYLNTKLLSKVIEETSPEYFGFIGRHNNIVFCSGSGYAISKNLTKKILQFKEQWNHNYIDDVSLGELLSNHGHTPTLARRFDIVQKINETQIDPSHYHYRIKIQGNRQLELGCHHLVHQKIINQL